MNIHIISSKRYTSCEQVYKYIRYIKIYEIYNCTRYIKYRRTMRGFGPNRSCEHLITIFNQYVIIIHNYYIKCVTGPRSEISKKYKNHHRCQFFLHTRHNKSHTRSPQLKHDTHSTIISILKSTMLNPTSRRRGARPSPQPS